MQEIETREHESRERNQTLAEQETLRHQMQVSCGTTLAHVLCDVSAVCWAPSVWRVVERHYQFNHAPCR